MNSEKNPATKNNTSRPYDRVAKFFLDRIGLIFNFLIFVIIIIIFWEIFVSNRGIIDERNYFSPLILLFSLGSFAMLAIRVMEKQSRNFRNEASEKLFSDLSDPAPESPLRLLVDKLLAEHLGSQGQEVVQAKLASAFKKSVDEHISDLIEEGFKLRHSSQASKEDGTAMADALRFATRMDEKYREQIIRLTTQQNRSLNIGLLFAFSGAVVLCLLLFAPKLTTPSGSNWEIIANYVSKALTVVFLEVFAFFFLRNYRLIFSEIKYYQQKRNDLQGKVVALRIAIASYEGEAMIERAFDAFLSMPEDKPYTRDHTTESLEREKMLNENQGRVYDLLEKMIEKLGSASTADKRPTDVVETD